MQTGEPQGGHGFGKQTGPAQRGDEVFDVVDANDEVIGQATRREVHAKRLWHRAVHVLVFEPVTEEAARGDGAEGTGGGGPIAGARRNGADGNGARGRVFLQKRSLQKDTAPGCWDSSCSGHLDTGESYAPAAVRELKEEIGLAVSGPEALTEILALPASADTGWEFVRVYRLESAGPFLLHPAEIERGEWWPVEEVTRAIADRPEAFSRAFRFIWAKVAA